MTGGAQGRQQLHGLSVGLEGCGFATTGSCLDCCCCTPCLLSPPYTYRCPSLANAPGGAEWWEAEFELPAALFKADFVVVDKNTGGVDNNKAKVCRAGEEGILTAGGGPRGGPCDCQTWLSRVLLLRRFLIGQCRLQ